MNAHWRSLNQDVPTSDALCRLTGTTRWLQATSPLPAHALLVLRQGDPRASDLPARPGPPRARPVKDERPTTQDAFHRIETSSRAFAMRTQHTRLSGRIRASTCAPFRQSWSLADSCQYPRTIPLSVGDSTRARSCLSVRLATRQGARSRCVRSISATQHSTNEHPYSPALGSSSAPQVSLAHCVYPMGCAHLDRGIERFTTPESLRQVARLRGDCSSLTLPRIRFRFLRRPTSSTPVASLARFCARFCRDAFRRRPPRSLPPRAP